MSTAQKHGAPTLRFKDESGRDYPDWEEKLLGEISNFIKGKGISKGDIVSNGAVECIRYGELYTHYGTTITHVISSTDIPLSRLELSNKNDVIVPSSGETASDIATAACLRLDGVALGGDINIIRCQQNGVFLAYYLNYKKPDIARLAQGISVIHLYASQLRLLKLSIPSKKEQQKIAAFLSAVDTKIEQLNRKKSLLEQYKKGMMQKLFSREIRFKDEGRRNYPDWEETKIGVVGEIHGGGTPDTNEKSLWNGEIIWFTPTEIKSKYSKSSARKISKAGLAQSSATLLPAGTILFTSRATIGEVSIATEECSTNQGFQSFVVNNQFSNEYIYYWILENRNEFIRRANGSTFLEVSKSEIKKMPFSAPGIKEQQKIANFLSAIDRKIELVADQIEQASVFKQGLLQQMFI